MPCFLAPGPETGMAGRLGANGRPARASASPVARPGLLGVWWIVYRGGAATTEAGCLPGPDERPKIRNAQGWSLASGKGLPVTDSTLSTKDYTFDGIERIGYRLSSLYNW
jgi:hypothetical protein